MLAVKEAAHDTKSQQTSYPSVLVFTSNSFDQYTGGGISLTNLFTHWQQDSLANLYIESEKVDHSVCQDFQKLGRERLKKIVKGDQALKKEVFDWIKQKDPDILFTTLGSYEMTSLIKMISEELEIPTVIQMADDWPHHFRQSDRLGFKSRKLKKMLEGLFQNSHANYVISNEMREAYQIDYGASFEVLINPVDLEIWNDVSPEVRQGEKTFLIRYIGTVHPYAQLSSLKLFAEAMSGMKEKGKKVRFEIYSPPFYLAEIKKEIGELPGIHYYEAPSSHKTPYVMKSADLLFLPINFDKKSFQYIRYSMPAKLIAYMASRVPVLILGPEATPPVRFAKVGQIAEYLTIPDPEMIQSKIEYLMADPTKREELSQKAFRIAELKYDLKTIRAQFQGNLISILQEEKR